MCECTHVEFILEALVTQPTLIEACDMEFAEVMPQIKDCLADNGVVVDAEATASEMLDLAMDLNFFARVQCYTPPWLD